jgi:hypothetical protein
VNPLPQEERARVEARLRFIARMMDTAFEVPGTKFRFGMDSIIGLVPGIGDAVGAIVSAYIVAEARRLGFPRRTIARMVANIAIDAIVGAVPLLGDAFDAAWKANIRNLRLMGITPEAPPPRRFVVNEARPRPAGA